MKENMKPTLIYTVIAAFLCSLSATEQPTQEATYASYLKEMSKYASAELLQQKELYEQAQLSLPDLLQLEETELLQQISKLVPHAAAPAEAIEQLKRNAAYLTIWETMQQDNQVQPELTAYIHELQKEPNALVALSLERYQSADASIGDVLHAQETWLHIQITRSVLETAHTLPECHELLVRLQQNLRLRYAAEQQKAEAGVGSTEASLTAREKLDAWFPATKG